jgi:hypothetical protein
MESIPIERAPDANPALSGTLPRLAETGTMFPLSREGSHLHSHSMCPGRTLCQRCRVHEIAGRRFRLRPSGGMRTALKEPCGAFPRNCLFLYCPRGQMFVDGT